MGAEESTNLGLVSEMAVDCPFSRDDWMMMYRRFSKLDSDGNLQIHPSEFRSVPDLAANPLLDQIIQALDQDGNGSIDFYEFCSGLSLFASKAPREQKVAFLFKLFDTNHDGYLDAEDLFHTLQLLAGDELSPQQMKDLVKQQIARNDLDGDGRLSLEEFEIPIAPAVDQNFCFPQTARGDK
jgi:serine/threonine-protein phosphatase 2B regulatory subunit